MGLMSREADLRHVQRRLQPTTADTQTQRCKGSQPLRSRTRADPRKLLKQLRIRVRQDNNYTDIVDHEDAPEKWRFRTAPRRKAVPSKEPHPISRRHP